jgi:hypothetical protein
MVEAEGTVRWVPGHPFLHPGPSSPTVSQSSLTEKLRPEMLLLILVPHLSNTPVFGYSKIEVSHFFSNQDEPGFQKLLCSETGFSCK